MATDTAQNAPKPPRRWLEPALIGGGAILVLALGWGVYLLALAGELTTLEYHTDAECHRVEGVIGAEDMVFTKVGGPPGGGVLVSSDDRRATVRGEPVRGAIHYVPLGSSAPEVVAVDGGEPAVFHPHGIDRTPAGVEPERLLVINHAGESLFGPSEARESGGPSHAIEVFDVVPGEGAPRLVHQRTISDPLLLSPNDVAAVDGERFYVTNDHSATTELGRKLEEFGRLPRGHVLYWDGASFSVVAETIHYANGITVSPDGASVYVSSITGGEVLMFTREPETGALTRRESVEVHAPDNISIAADGSLWIGVHPKLLTFTGYAKDPSKLSPSKVVRIHGEAGAWTVDELFLSDGSDISGSSVALPVGDGRFLIGSVFDAWLLDCTGPS